jgi:hypothetical protein
MHTTATSTDECQAPRPAYRFTRDAPPAALAHLREAQRWVAWRYEWKDKRQKWDKPPIDPRSGRYASVDSPSTWASFDEAKAGMERHGADGVGLILIGDDDIVGGDLDDCINDAGCYSPLAAQVLSYAETYAERSPSGEGIRFFARGRIDKALKDDDAGVEVYSRGRYLTVTGDKVDVAPEEMKEAPRTLAYLTETIEAQRAAKRGKTANGNGHAQTCGGSDFFVNVNAAALARLDSWVPTMHPTARKHSNGAWRITSESLNRDLEEDLAYHPDGIRDHGEESGLTPIDAVLKYGDTADAKSAAFWLCQRMGIEPASLGWIGAASSKKNGAKATANIQAWPIMESKAMHGIVGRIARLATENSEADPVAVIASTLAYAAAEFGMAQYTRVGDDVHHSRHFDAIVGQSSRARKGTSYGPVRRIFDVAEQIRTSKSTLPFPSGSKLKISNGPLSSGEGLVYAVRDGSDDEEDGDPGVQDKRLLVVEQELGAALRAFQRTGNNLSMILRMAFDGGTIAPLTKNNRTVATNPHINVLGHITRQELSSLLSATEIWNGLGNRFQWLMARRPKTVAFPKPMPDEEVKKIAEELAEVITLAHKRGENGSRELVLSNSAQVHWANIYPELTGDYPGVLGAVTSRQEAHARRLALTYAQLDGAERIEIQHLEAALAFCRYAFDSAAYLFGDAELDPIAQKIIEALKSGPKSQTELMSLFQRNLKAEVLTVALRDLQERGRISLETRKTGERGRPTLVWSIYELNELNEQ